MQIVLKFVLPEVSRAGNKLCPIIIPNRQDDFQIILISQTVKENIFRIDSADSKAPSLLKTNFTPTREDTI